MRNSKGQFVKGVRYNLGLRRSDETKRKISLAKKGKKNNSKTKFTTESTRNEKHWNWRGGISKIDKRIRRTPNYKQWRSDVFKRDSWTCQTCRINGVYVTVHHIKSFASILKLNNIKTLEEADKCFELWDITNGVTLCEPCHALTDNYRGRARATR